MKYLPLLWRSLFRRKVRTIFTVLAVLVAFTLFGFLVAIEAAFGMGVELAGNERLVLIHKVSLIQLLPESYLERIRATPGVTDVCHQTWFGGIYQDPKNFFMQTPVDPDCLLRMYPEYTPVSYTHLRAHETRHDLVCRLLLEKKKKKKSRKRKQKKH